MSVNMHIVVLYLLLWGFACKLKLEALALHGTLMKIYALDNAGIIKEDLLGIQHRLTMLSVFVGAAVLLLSLLLIRNQQIGRLVRMCLVSGSCIVLGIALVVA